MSETLVLNSDGMPVSVLPLSRMRWQTVIKGMCLGAINVVETYDDWIVRSPSTSIPVPSVVMTSNYVRFGRMARFDADNVFLRDLFHCAYCNEEFRNGGLTMDHVHPASFGGRTTWENIVSACGPCNNKRGNNTRIQPRFKPYRPTYYELADKRRQFPIEVPHASWVQYIGWDEQLVKVKAAKGERPTKLTMLDDEDELDMIAA